MKNLKEKELVFIIMSISAIIKMLEEPEKAGIAIIIFVILFFLKKYIS